MKLLRRLLLALAILWALPDLASAQAPPDGAALYASTCSGCHGPLATSTISQGGRNLTSIKSANMTWGLTDLQLEAITGALTNLRVSTGSLPSGQVGTAYSVSLTATGGTAPYSWSPWGTLPNWLTLTNSGVLSGTPAAAGTTTLAIQVSDSLIRTAYATLTLTINPPAVVPPSITTQPASQTVTAGQSATFSVAASGTAPLSYQWRKNGTAISGATSASYTTPATTTADNGAQFTVVVSNSAGSVTSNAATLTVNAAVGALSVTPSSLSFNYGSSVPPAQSISVNATGIALSYTAASSVPWLSVSPANGTTPGTVTVSVSPNGWPSGTYKGNVTIAASGAASSSSPQIVQVTMVVSSPPTSSASLIGNPSALSFTYRTSAGTSRESRYVRVSSKGAPQSFTASHSGGSWLSVSPTTGSTPATLRVSVNPLGMPPGSYTDTIVLSAPGATGTSVGVTLTIGSADGNGASDLYVQPYTYDPAQSGAVTAQWINGLGVSPASGTDASHLGLLLAKNATAPQEAHAGAVIQNAQGLTLTQLGFDVSDSGQCTATSPRFVVVTTDDVMHIVGGCAKGTAQPVPSVGWRRVQFDPSKPEQASPPITPGQQVKSIAVVLDAAGGLVVLDNISVSGVIVRKQ